MKDVAWNTRGIVSDTPGAAYFEAHGAFWLHQNMFYDIFITLLDQEDGEKDGRGMERQSQTVVGSSRLEGAGRNRTRSKTATGSLDGAKILVD